MRYMLLASLLLCSSLAVAESIHGDMGGIRFNADYYERDDQSGEIIARGNVFMAYGGDSISAEEVRVDKKTKDIFAEGPVVFKSRGTLITAKKLKYNFASHTGVMEDAIFFSETQPGSAVTSPVFEPKTGFDIMSGAPKARFVGKRMEKNDASNNWIIYDGEFTNCVDCKIPEWKFTGSKLKATEDGYVIINNPIFYVLNIPLFYVPIAAIPYSQERKSGFLPPIYEISESDGNVVENKFYLVLGRSHDATFSLAWLQFRGLKPGFEYRYSLADDFNGSVNGRYLNDKIFNKTYNVDDRWSVRLFNNGYFPSHRMDLKWDVNLTSDDDYVRRYPEEVVGLGDGEMESKFIFSKHWPLTNLTAEALYYEDLTSASPVATNETTVHRLPEVQWNIMQVPFFNSFMTLRMLAGYTNFLTEDARFIDNNGTPGFQWGTTDQMLRAQRIDVRPTISLYALPVRGVQIIPQISLNESVYLMPSLGDNTGEFRYYSVGGKVITDFERVFDVNWGKTKKIRHQIEPSVEYGYLPQIMRDDVPNIDLLSTTKVRNELTYGISNNFDFKAVSPNGVATYTRPLSLAAKQVLDIQKLSDNSGREFSPIEFELDIFFPFVQSTTEMFWDVHGRALESVSTAWVISDMLGNSYSSSFSYNITDSRRNIRWGTQIGMFPRVKGFANMEYSFDDDQIIEQVYGLSFIPKSRCWRVDVGFVDRIDADPERTTIAINLIYGLNVNLGNFSKYRPFI